MPITITSNAADASKLIDKINAQIAASWPQLYGQLGRVFQQNVQDRIASQDEGRWSKASKWVQAKKGTNYKILQGAGEYVKYKADGKSMTLYGDTGKDWTLTMHNEGFENEVEQVDSGGKLSIDIVNPGPLGLKAGTTEFSWYPRNLEPSQTPARKIWPTQEESVAITTPIYSRWLQATVNRAVQGSGASVTGSVF